MKRILLSTLLLGYFALPAISWGDSVTVGQKESGLAAVYSRRLNGHVTSSGQLFSESQMTAAHKTLPFGTRIKVTNPRNHRSVVLRVSDRGPMQQGRMLDITTAAAHRLGIPANSMRPVDMEVVSVGNGHTTPQHKQ